MTAFLRYGSESTNCSLINGFAVKRMTVGQKITTPGVFGVRQVAKQGENTFQLNMTLAGVSSTRPVVLADGLTEPEANALHSALVSRVSEGGAVAFEDVVSSLAVPDHATGVQ